MRRMGEITVLVQRSDDANAKRTKACDVQRLAGAQSEGACVKGAGRCMEQEVAAPRSHCQGIRHRDCPPKRRRPLRTREASYSCIVMSFTRCMANEAASEAIMGNKWVSDCCLQHSCPHVSCACLGCSSHSTNQPFLPSTGASTFLVHQ